MAPKKGGKGKGKGKGPGDGPEDGAPLTPQEEAAMHEAMCKALKMQLADRTEDVSQSLAEKRRLEGEVEKIKKDFEEEQKSAFEITRDMTRQYKGMQEQLVDRITQLSVTVQELQDKLEEAEQKLEETVREKDRVIAAKDDDITLLKSKMEDMAQEFGGMLKETLDKMRERIELSSTNFDMEASGVPVQRQMEEFSLNFQQQQAKCRSKHNSLACVRKGSRGKHKHDPGRGHEQCSADGG